MTTSATADLELVALARLGIAPDLTNVAPPRAGESLLDALVRARALATHQAIAVRSYLARHTVTCRCGRRALAPEDAQGFPCPGCNQNLLRHSQTGSWRAAGGAPQIAEGSRVGPLLLVELIGKGASGAVYRARHEQLGRESALKVLPAAALDVRKRKRFEREVEALARLDHPAIVKVHATYEAMGCLCAEMELVAGETLEKKVARDGPLEWRHAAELVATVARAVDHAHRAGVIHRDLKPENVLIRAQTGDPLLADFGLTRLTDQTSSLTVAGGIMGTPVYMAPEAFQGSSDSKVDVYGLGAILYHALTGRPPYQEANLAALFFRVSRGDCPPTSAPGAPRDLEVVRAKAMAPGPSQRHRTPAELADDLEKVLRGERVRDSLASHVARASRRPAVRIGASTAVALVSVLAAWLVARGPGAPGSPSVASVEGALLAFEKGEPDPARRAQAFQVLAQASRPQATGQNVLLRELDPAIQRAPGSAELRHVRALLCRSRGYPVRAEDVAGVGSSAYGEEDLDAVAAHALSAGLAGDAPMGPLRATWAAHERVAALALLFAVTACQRGEPALRDDVARAFRLARPQQPRHAFIARGFADVDRCCEALEKDDFRGPPLDGDLKGRLVELISSLTRDPGYPAALGLILHPLGPAIRRTWRRNLMFDVMNSPRRLDLLAILDGSDQLPPQLLAIREILRTAEVDRDVPMKLSYQVQDAVSRALVDDDPLLAAVLAEHSAQDLLNQASRTPDVVRFAMERFGRAERCLEAFERSGDATGGETYFLLSVRRRCGVGRGGLYEALAEQAQSYQERLRLLESALVERKAAFRASGNGVGVLINLRAKDARQLTRTYFLLDRTRECEDHPGLLDQVPGGDGVRAELARRRGDLARARELLTGAPTSYETLAAGSLLARDEGRRDEAQRLQRELEDLERRTNNSSWLEAFQSRKVREAIAH